MNISCNLFLFLGFQTSSDLKRHKKTRVHQVPYQIQLSSKDACMLWMNYYILAPLPPSLMLGARGTRWLRGRWERGNRLQHRHRPRPGRKQKPKLILHAWTIRSWRTARQTAEALPPHSSSPPRRSPPRQPASSSPARRTRSPHRQASPSRGRRTLEACPTSWSPGRPWPCTAEPREATPPSSWVFSSAASQGRPRFNYSKMSNIAILQHHLGPVRHQVGDLGASPPGEGDQQSRRAGGGDGVIVEEETHPPALATCLVLV